MSYARYRIKYSLLIVLAFTYQLNGVGGPTVAGVGASVATLSYISHQLLEKNKEINSLEKKIRQTVLNNENSSSLSQKKNKVMQERRTLFYLGIASLLPAAAGIGYDFFFNSPTTPPQKTDDDATSSEKNNGHEVKTDSFTQSSNISVQMPSSQSAPINPGTNSTADTKPTTYKEQIRREAQGLGGIIFPGVGSAQPSALAVLPRSTVRNKVKTGSPSNSRQASAPSGTNQRKKNQNQRQETVQGRNYARRTDRGNAVRRQDRGPLPLGDNTLPHMRRSARAATTTQQLTQREFNAPAIPFERLKDREIFTVYAATPAVIDVRLPLSYNTTTNKFFVAPIPLIQENYQSPIRVQRSSLEDVFVGATLGAALGDAWGRLTEFKTLDQQFRKYRNGITSFASFNNNDFFPNTDGRLDAQWGIGIYTDDTQMAIHTFKSMIKAEQEQFNQEEVIEDITKRFIAYRLHPDEGWLNTSTTAKRRAPGKTVLTALDSARENYFYRQKMGYAWTQTRLGKRPTPGNIAAEGGCGTVMSAWPIGLVYYNYPNYAAGLAAEKSSITHRNPLARASSACLAAGIAHIIQGKQPNAVAQEMITVAEKYETQDTTCYYFDPNSNVQKVIFSIDQIDAAQNAYNKAKGIQGSRPRLSVKLKRAVWCANMVNQGQKIPIGSFTNTKRYRDREWNTFLETHRSSSRSGGGAMIAYIKRHHKNHPFFYDSTSQHKGWVADDALATALFTYLIFPNDLKSALFVSVHTPGDSDSIASIAGALVGAAAGFNQSLTVDDTYQLENVGLLKLMAKQAAQVASKQSF